jgi:hypothetical protein
MGRTVGSAVALAYFYGQHCLALSSALVAALRAAGANLVSTLLPRIFRTVSPYSINVLSRTICMYVCMFCINVFYAIQYWYFGVIAYGRGIQTKSKHRIDLPPKNEAHSYPLII